MLFGSVDRSLVDPMLRFGLPFMPSRVALWALNLSNRLLVAWLATRSLAGVFVVGANLAQSVALLVTAFQLAWPPFAYAIKDDGEARVVYRSVLTVWMLVALAVVLPLALARDWLIAVLAGEQWLDGADAMALTALGLAFYGAYYVVGVAVGRVKRTGDQLGRHGHRRGHERRALHRADPRPRCHRGRRGLGHRLLPDGVAHGGARQPGLPGRLRLGAPGRALRTRRRRSSCSATRRSRSAEPQGVAGRLIVAALFVPLALSLDLAVRRAAPGR